MQTGPSVDTLWSIHPGSEAHPATPKTSEGSAKGIKLHESAQHPNYPEGLILKPGNSGQVFHGATTS